MRAAFLEPFTLRDSAISVGASVGGGVWPGDGGTVNDLVRHADAAMYEDKARGRHDGASDASPSAPVRVS